MSLSPSSPYPATERVVLIEYYGLEGDRLTLKEIAARHNVTRERARGIKARGEWRIRKQLKFQSAISDVSEPLPGKGAGLADKLSKLTKAVVPGTRLKQGRLKDHSSLTPVFGYVVSH